MSHITGANKWREESLKGLLCTKFQCYNKPRNHCSECSIYYCNEHVTSHIHTDTFQDLQKKQERNRDHTE
jgi:hypothetical protein